MVAWLARLLLILLCCGMEEVWLGGACAVAQAPSAASADAEARRAFESGRDAYERGDFTQALRDFEQAQELRPSPELLYNVGRAADSDGQASRAVAAYSAYLASYPSADNRDFVRARLEKMRALERVAKSAQALPTVAQSSPAVTHTADAVNSVPHVDEAPTRPFWKRAWFWSTVGAAVAGGVVAAVLVAHDRAPRRAAADAYIITPEGR